MDRLDAIVQELRVAAITPDEPPLRIRRRASRRWLLLLLLPVVVVVSVALRPDPTPGIAATVVRTTDPWTATVERIDRLRMQAFIDDDPAALMRVEVRDSPAFNADLRVMADLRARDVVLDHNPMRVLAVSEEYVTLSGTVQRARLRVTDVLDGYALLDDTGTVVSRIPSRSPRNWLLDLQRTRSSDWKLVEATPAALSQSSAPAKRRGN